MARNVPGSASAVMGELSEASGDALMGGIHNVLLRIRGDDRVEGNSSSFAMVNLLGEDQTQTMMLRGGNAGFLNENGFGFAVSLDYRNIDNDDLEADLFDGSFLLLHRLNPDLLLYGGVIGEIVEGETHFNAGKVDSQGVGAAGGFDFQLGENLSLTGALAYLSLDYDVTRSGGTITGSFDARRFMADLQANSFLQSGDQFYTFNLGARYINQENNGYRESGGALVGSTDHTTLSALAGARVRFNRVGMDPFLETDLRYDLVDESDLPTGVADPSSTRFNARFGAGLAHSLGDVMLEVGAGLHVTEDGYDGFDGRLRAVIRF